MPKIFTKEEICAYLTRRKIPCRPYLAIRKIGKENQHSLNYYHSHLTGGYSFMPFGYKHEDLCSKAILVNPHNGQYKIREENDAIHTGKFPKELNLTNLEEKVKSVYGRIELFDFLLKEKKLIAEIELPVEVAEPFDRYCEIFGEPHTYNMHSKVSCLSYSDITLITTQKDEGDIILNNSPIYGESSLNNLANSLSNSKKIIQAVANLQNKPEWDLVRVIVESDTMVYECQIEQYNKLLNGELDALIGKGEVIQLTEKLYGLPKRFDIDEVSQGDEIEKDLITIDATHISFFIKKFALFWAKINNLNVSDLQVYKFAKSVERTIWDALYRDELKLHYELTGEIIEYSNYTVFSSGFLLYWNEMAVVLNKNGIKAPRQKTLLEFLGLNVKKSKDSAGNELIEFKDGLEKSKWHSAALRFAISEIVSILEKKAEERKGVTNLKLGDLPRLKEDIAPRVAGVLQNQGTKSLRTGNHLKAETLKDVITIKNIFSYLEAFPDQFDPNNEIIKRMRSLLMERDEISSQNKSKNKK